MEMITWHIPIHDTLGQECITVEAMTANDACQIAWNKLNDDSELDMEFIDYWGCDLDWDYTILKYPNDVLNIWDMTLFHAEALA